MTSALGTARRRVIALWPWTVPFLVAGFIYATQARFVERGIAGLIALGIVYLAARRPDRSILILIVGLPFQALVLAQIYAWGAPVQVVRPLASWKEVLGLGVVVAGVRGYRASHRRLDRLDLLAIGYVATVAAYALVPKLFAPDAPIALDTRSLGFRASAGFVILFLAARHAQLPADFVPRATRVVLVVGGVVAAIAVYEYFFSDSWNRFVIERVEFVRYQIEVLKSPPGNVFDIRKYSFIGGHKFVRAGSVFLDSTPAGFYLILPFAVAVERRLRAGVHSGAATSFLVLTGAGIVLTQTRAALIAGLVVVFLAVRPAKGRSTSRRVRFAFIFAAGVILLVPAAASTGLSERVTSTVSGEESSSTDHVRSFWDGVEAIGDAPLGHGLGTSAGVGQRFSEGRTTVTENGYLQVGVETGLAAMLLFAALTIAMIRRLNLATHLVAEPGVSAVRGAAFGLAVGAFLLHTWNEFAVAWTLWALAGAAIGLLDAARTTHPRSLEPTAGRA